MTPAYRERIVQELFDAAERMPDATGMAFSIDYARYCKQVGRREGFRALDAVMAWCDRNRDEAPLLFVPLVATLPRRETLRRLKAFQRSRNEYIRIYAGEMLTELRMTDTQALDKALRAEK